MPDNEQIEPPVGIEPSKAKNEPSLVSLLFFNFINETKEGKVNLLGVFDRIYVDPETKVSLPFGVFVRVANAFGAPVRCDAFTPDNSFVGGLMLLAEEGFKLPDGRKPIQIQIAGHMKLTTPVEGTYWFVVSYKEKVLGACPLLVEYKDLKELESEHTRGDG